MSHYPFGSAGDVHKMRLLTLLRDLRLITPETYASTLSQHIDPMSQVQYEMERMNKYLAHQIEQVVFNADIQKATGAALVGLHEMMGIL